MESISLENGIELYFEKLPHVIRLIVSKNDQEWVCRKEKLKNLLAFTCLGEAHAFKGRLQLIKKDKDIAIQVNHKHIGTISTGNFLKALNKLK